MSKTILVVFGTRPDTIKMAPLIRVLQEEKHVHCVTVLTAQHRALCDEALSVFSIRPDYDLNIMKPNQDLAELTEQVLRGLTSILETERPALVLVHGDTTTAFAAALACFYLGIPVGHVEAGLRTHDLSSPFPEEWNRRAIGLLATYHFAPTEQARQNLLREGVSPSCIAVTGNTVMDALGQTVCSDFAHPLREQIGDRPLILLTAHRREHRGTVMKTMLRGVRRFAEEFDEPVILCPVHPAPAVREVFEGMLGGLPHVILTEPQSPFVFHNLLARCCFCVTDSGGIQEEALSLSKPVLVLRRSTERMEGVAAGGARLIGVAEGSVYRGLRDLWEQPAVRAAMAAAPCPYGDGRAARRIVEFLVQNL